MQATYKIFTTARLSSAGNRQIRTNVRIIICSFILLPFIFSSCKKSLLVNPPSTSILGSGAYINDATAISVLNGLYSQIATPSTSSEGNITSLSFFAGLSADEFTLLNTVTNTNQLAYYKNALVGSSNIGSAYWTKSYTNIFTCNAAIEGLNTSSSLTPEVRQELLGEAKFMRAFFYFYLVNLYGDVPLALSSDYNVNSTLARTPKVEVYKQIVNDLLSAEGSLADGYLQANLIQLYSANTVEKVRPNKYAAAALLARVYLFTNDYANAEAQANKVINNTTYYGLTTLNNVFLKNSREAIWQLQPVNATWNTEDAKFFIYPTSGGPTTSNPVYLSNGLLSSFEAGDQRKVNTNWINSITIGTTTYSYPFKYKIYLANASITTASSITEYMMMLRLGEQYLIRAEAEANLGDMTDAATDLNAIRNRAGLPVSTVLTASSNLPQAMAAILHERQVELFSELGQRWFDLKRTGTVDAVMGAGGACVAKGGIWNSYQALYPLPISDINKDANLIQNLGY